MQFISETDQKPSFDQFELLVAVPSLGNVGQLAADILISNFAAKRVGYLYTKYILPVVGNDPYYKNTKGEMHTASEGTV